MHTSAEVSRKSVVRIQVRRANGQIVELGTVSDERHNRVQRKLNDFRVYLVQKYPDSFLLSCLNKILNHN